MKRYFLLILLITITNAYSQNDWQLLNPLPTHNTGSKIHFMDENHGFILTYNELLETIDFGENWSINSTHTSALDMDFNENIGVILARYSYVNNNSKYTLDGGQTWTSLNSPPVDEFRNIKIFEDNTIYITSSRKLYKTSNFGQDWETIEIPHNNIVKSVFINAMIGYICTSNGKIAKTIDGGKNWELQYNLPNSAPNNFVSMYFYNENVGFAFREHSTLFRTNDGGQTWLQTNDMPFDVYSYYFINEQVGYIGGDLGRLQKTVNGGQSWTNVTNYNFNYGSPSYSALYFKNTANGIAIGARGLILKTNNGQNWQPYSFTYDPIRNAYLFGNTGFAHTHQRLYKTADSGETWFNINKPAGIGIIRSIQFFNDNTGFMLAASPTNDDYTKLFKTTDGGLTWNSLSNEFTGRIRMDFINENLGFSFSTSPSNHTEITTNGGQSFQSLGWGNTYKDFNFINQNTGYAIMGYYKIVRTNDGGHNWELVHENPEDVVDIQFFSENLGYMITDQYSSFFKTKDGGATWIQLSAPQDFLKSIHFYTETDGYLIDDDNIIYHTTDGGETWNFSVTYGYTFNGSSLRINGNNVILSGDNGIISKTTNNVMSVPDFPINSKLKIKLYPNPASEIVNIQIDNNLTVNKVEVYNFNGKLISTEETNKNNISVRHLKQGIYILKVYTQQNEIFSSKLVIN